MYVSKDESVVIMNVNDPLDNHRKNLHNFYTACNVFCDTEKTKGGENPPSSFLPFFHFVDTSASKSFHGPENFVQKIIQHRDVTNGKPCIIEMDDQKSYSEEDIGYKVDLLHIEPTVFGEKPVSDLCSEVEGKLNAVTYEKNEDRIAEYGNRIDDTSNAFHKHYLLSQENNSSAVGLQDCEINDHPISSKEKRILFSCERCAKTFRHKSGITRHISKCSVRLQIKQDRKRLDEIRPKKWTKSAIIEKTCKICGHIARKPCELKLHLSKHTGERPFLCNECGVGFSSTSKLNRHIRNKVHAKGKLYCEPCKRYFTSVANYERHKSEHSLPIMKKKPFACSICDKRFSRVDILRKHIDVHSQENRELFECVACGRKFSRKDTLSRHIRQNKCGEMNRKH